MAAEAQDRRGALSEFSQPRTLLVDLSGFALGPLLISFKSLVGFLSVLLALAVLIAIYLVVSGRLSERKFNEQKKELNEALKDEFKDWRRSLKKQIEMLDQQPGFSRREKRIYRKMKAEMDALEKILQEEVSELET